MEQAIKSFKGFDKDLKCKGFQYEIGKDYKEDKAEKCECGFHACEHPLDVLAYYPPIENNRYCEVEQSGEMSSDNDDTKIASTKIHIGAEIGIKGLISAAFNYTKERCINEKTGDSSALTGGDMSIVYGNGKYAKVRGGNGSILALAEYDDNYNFIKNHVRSVDGKIIKENTYYTLVNGDFVVAEE